VYKEENLDHFALKPRATGHSLLQLISPSRVLVFPSVQEQPQSTATMIPALPPNWVFSMFAFIGFLLCCIPFPWHLAAWNTGTCLYMAWTGVTCLALFINSIVWNGNAINWAPVWCDITSRLYIGTAFAIPATSLCIARRLYLIATVRNVVTTKIEKRRAVLIDFAIGLGVPILGIILQYIAQGHRFNILENVGCYPYTYNTPVGIVLVYVPPIVIGCISGVYAVMGIWAFNKSRKQYNEFLSAGQLTNHRYARLMCLSGFGSLATIILGSYVLYRNCVYQPIYPWVSWANTHADFHRVDQYPEIIWSKVSGFDIEFSRWMNVICAFTFFAFFGFAEEARRYYATAAQSVTKRLGISTGSFGSSFFGSVGLKSKLGVMSSGGGATLPVFIQNHTIRKVDDLDSISDMSVSSRDIGGSEKEKSFSPDVSYGAMSLADVGGVLADYKAEPYSPTPTSGASSATSLSPPASSPAAVSHASPSRPDSSIDVSSIHYVDGNERPMSITVPEFKLNVTSASRHATDIPPGVHGKPRDMV